MLRPTIARFYAKQVNKVATAGKGNRGRKRKSPEKADAPVPKAKVARMSEAQVEEDRRVESHFWPSN